MRADDSSAIVPSDREWEVRPAWTLMVGRYQKAETARRRKVERFIFVDVENLSEQVQLSGSRFDMRAAPRGMNQSWRSSRRVDCDRIGQGKTMVWPEYYHGMIPIPHGVLRG